MLSHALFTATALLAASLVSAQTFSSCNPTWGNVSCPADLALGTSATFNFTNQVSADSAIWNTTAGVINYELDGAEFTIKQKGDAPTIQSNFYIFFGRISVVMKAAPGVGIVSSIVLLSDDLDEVDIEWIGGNNSYVETNYFGKDNTTSYDRATWVPVKSPTDTYHNYTTHWTAEKLDWYIDGDLVRTLMYADALNGTNYPQTPMRLSLGSWAGGDSTSNGTVEWAGGHVDYKEAPFTMTVQSVEVEDFSSGSSYTYGGTTGDWQSIKIASGNSTIAQRLNTPHGVTAKFSSLSRATQIGIAAGIIVICVIAMIALTVCCIKSRRAGRRERAIADAAWERQLMELKEYKRMQVAEKEIHPRGGYL